MDIPSIVAAFGIPARVADSALESLQWLREDNEPKVLMINTSEEIPRMFI